MGIRKNEIEAMKWLTKAAGQGNELANKELDKIKPK